MLGFRHLLYHMCLNCIGDYLRMNGWKKLLKNLQTKQDKIAQADSWKLQRNGSISEDQSSSKIMKWFRVPTLLGSWPFRNNTQHSWLFNNLFGLAQDGSDTPGNQGDEPRPIRRPGALWPDVSRPIAPGQKASPRSTPILTPLQFLFGDL